MQKVIGIAAVALVVLGVRVQACRCVPPGTPKDELNQSLAVFSGQVVAMKIAPGKMQRVTFRVLKSWKGPRRKQAVIWTTVDPDGCGYEFQKGKKYLVYATGAPGKLETNLCGRTGPLELSGEDIQGFH